jgi:hypothetical protein
MMSPSLRNIAASVHQRLLNKSRESAHPFNELFQYYAIKETFSTRHTVIPVDPIALTETFMKDERKTTQWKAFLRKNRMVGGPDTFEEAVRAVSLFLKPIVESLANNKPVPATWKASGPWQR